MKELNEHLATIQNSINWLSKEVEKLQKSKSPNEPLDEEKTRHAMNLQNKLDWERKQIEKYNCQ